VSRAARIDLDPAELGRGLAEVVLALLELLREVLERQAVRRLDAGQLTAAQTERVGAALRDARQQLRTLRETLADASSRPADAQRKDES
jgi:hypothetical protein